MTASRVSLLEGRFLARSHPFKKKWWLKSINEGFMDVPFFQPIIFSVVTASRVCFVQNVWASHSSGLAHVVWGSSSTEVAKSGGEILFTLKAYNGRVVSEWLAWCLGDAVRGGYPDERLPMTHVALKLSRIALQSTKYIQKLDNLFPLPYDGTCACTYARDDFPGTRSFQSPGACMHGSNVAS